LSKKIIITGHTKGIGLATYDLLKENKYSISGISRKNGYDLLKDYQKIKNHILDESPDIFINNAYVPWNQTKLLKDLYKSWKLKDKLIVNICSVAGIVPLGSPDYNSPYVVDKRDQKLFCDDINFHYSRENFLKTRCVLTNLCFDYVSTNFKSKNDKRLYPNLSAEQVADIIHYTIQGFEKNICFREISFHSTNKPEIIN